MSPAIASVSESIDPSTHPSTSPSLSWVAIGKEEWHIHARGSLSATQ